MKFVSDFLAAVGATTLACLAALGDFCLFALALLRHVAILLRKPLLTLRATYAAGVFVAADYFGRRAVRRHGAVVPGLYDDGALRCGAGARHDGGAVAVAGAGAGGKRAAFCRRAGSAITAEIGLMKTTEQLVAMEMMAIEPVAQVGVPRFLGAWFALPLLTILFVAVAIIGAHLVGVVYLGLDDGIFWSGMQNSVDFGSDVVRGMLLKSLVFGWVCAAIAVFSGFQQPANRKRYVARDNDDGGDVFTRRVGAEFCFDRDVVWRLMCNRIAVFPSPWGCLSCWRLPLSSFLPCRQATRAASV